MFNRLFLLALVSGLLAGLASFIYQKVYASSLGTGFFTVVKPLAIFASSLVGCLIAAVGYWLINKWLGQKGEIVFNLVFVILSFATILAPFATKLPLTVDTPELFPGLAVPMHFFPALAWLTLQPLFLKRN